MSTDSLTLGLFYLWFEAVLNQQPNLVCPGIFSALDTPLYPRNGARCVSCPWADIAPFLG